MDMAVCSPQGGSGSGSGSGLQICSDSTPDSERVNNKPVFVPAPPSHSPTGSPTPRTPTRRHRHHHQGLLSPIPSFAALLSPASSRPVTPSPLRILHPSTPTTPSLALTPATATSLLFSTDTETYTYHPRKFDLDFDMPVHQPRPQHPEPSSASLAHLRPTTPSRPPSRSEKLLREALLRDQDRPPMPHSPYTAAAVPTLSSLSQSRSPGNARHRRRHSEVPAQYPSPTEHARIFRSPATSPRAPSPEPSPSLARRHSHTQRQQQQLQQQQQQYHHGYQASQASQSPTRSTHLARRPSVNSQPRGASPSSTTRSRGHTHPTTNTSTSGISRNRVPQPLPLGPESHYHPSQYPQYPQYQQQHQHQGEPVVMTPHEQVLRARLEQVLQSGKVVRSPAAKGTYDEWRREDSSPTADDEHEHEQDSFGSSSNDASGSGSGEDDNVVRDENGLARPWKRSPRAVGGMMSPPTTTSGSGSGSTSARSESQERVYVRSRTEPVLPAMMQQLPASPYHGHPRRSATAPGAPGLGLRGMVAPPSAGHRYHPHHHHHHHHQRSGTTPPLVSDGSPTPPEDEDEDEDEFDEEEEEYEGDLEGRGMRMLTPPLTPPSHSAAYHGYYVPSPYFNGKGLAPVSAGKERRGRTLVGRGRPSVHCGVVDLEGSEEDDHEYVEGEGEGYFGSGGVGVDDAVYRAHMARQFNVRRASAKAREMEGYVSFSAVEGLGAPPESGSSEEEDERKEGKKGGVGGWVRRLWGSEGQVVV